MRDAMPAPSPDDISQRALDVAEWAAKFVIALAAIAAFVKGIALPAATWWEARKVAQIRRALAPEIEKIERLTQQEDGCVSRMEAVVERQEVIFTDLDTVLNVVIDNRDRLDEVNDLLDAVGFDADRREDVEKRNEVTTMIVTLRERKKDRQRELAERRSKQQTD